jgi:hypothetical protein
MAVVGCVCEKCGNSFFCRDEMYHPPVKNIFRTVRKSEVPRTWEEWILHLSTNCENCRLPYIPSSCEKDLEKLKGA